MRARTCPNLAAAHAGAISGRRLQPGPALRRRARRMRVLTGAQPAVRDIVAALRNRSRTPAAGARTSRSTPWPPSSSAKPTPRPGKSTPNTRATPIPWRRWRITAARSTSIFALRPGRADPGTGHAGHPDPAGLDHHAQRADLDRAQLLAQMQNGYRLPPIVGSPQTVADALAGWMRETDIDGFNLTRLVAHESLRDFVDLVVPELQSRGIYKKTTRPARCAKSCSARAPRGCRPRIRPPATGRSRRLKPGAPVARRGHESRKRSLIDWRPHARTRRPAGRRP